MARNADHDAFPSTPTRRAASGRHFIPIPIPVLEIHSAPLPDRAIRPPRSRQLATIHRFTSQDPARRHRTGGRIRTLCGGAEEKQRSSIVRLRLGRGIRRGDGGGGVSCSSGVLARCMHGCAASGSACAACALPMGGLSIFCERGGEGRTWRARRKLGI